MDTFKIKAILAVVEYGNLSRAAEEFSYTPSSFSHMLTSFEKEIGIKLFNRHSKGVSLTENGKKLIENFKEIVQTEEKFLNKIVSLKECNDNNLTIAAYSSISRSIISDILKRLKKERPEINVSVSVCDDLIDLLKKGKADIVFGDSRNFSSYEWLPIFTDKYFVVAPKGMIKEKQISIEKLYNFPYIFTDDFFLTDYLNTSLFKEITVFRSYDDLSIIKAVKDGLGLTVLPELVINGITSEVDVIPLEENITRTLGITYNKEKIRVLKLEKFIASIASYAKENI